MDDEPNGYQTYVLRLWRARCQGKWQWRTSIESPHTGERQVFAGLQQLFGYLSEQEHASETVGCIRASTPVNVNCPREERRQASLPGLDGCPECHFV
jgi:hypothetical protein